MGIDPQSALQMQLGLGELARLGQSAAQVGFCVSVVRTQADGGAIVLNRFEESILRDKSTCQIVVRVKIVWLCTKRGMQIWYGLADSPRGQGRRTQGIIGACALRRQSPPRSQARGS